MEPAASSEVRGSTAVHSDLDEVKDLVPRDRVGQSAARKNRNWNTCRKQFLNSAMPRAAAALLSASSNKTVESLKDEDAWHGPPPDARIDDRTGMIEETPYYQLPGHILLAARIQPQISEHEKEHKYVVQVSVLRRPKSDYK